MSQIKVAILVLNYNGLRYLRGLFESATFLKEDTDTEVVLVDNASWDESIAYVSREFPWVKIIRNKSNYGWGEGYNQAIDTLRTAGNNYTHYLFLNNDVFVTPDWWSELKTALVTSEDNIAEWGCRAVFAEPFAKETLFCVKNKSQKPRAATTAHYPHESMGYEATSGEFTVRLQPKRMGNEAAEQCEDQFHYSYELRAFEPNAEAFSIELAPHLDYEISAEAKSKKIIKVFHAEKQPVHQSKEIHLQPRQTLFVRRLLKENELVTLVQNSGSGLNNAFEGYDIHCYEPADCPQNTDKLSAICGVCKVVRADAFHQIKGFDPAFFMYYEDTDFSLRLQKAGYKIKLIDHAILRHMHAGTSGAHSPFFARQVAWSLLYFHSRHASWHRLARTYVKYTIHALTELLDSPYKPAQVHLCALQTLNKRDSQPSGRCS